MLAGRLESSSSGFGYQKEKQYRRVYVWWVVVLANTHLHKHHHNTNNLKASIQRDAHQTFCGLVKESDSWRIKSARLPCFRHRSDGAPKHLRNLRQNRARITGGQRLPPPSSSSFFPPPPVRWSCTAPSPDLPEEACCRLICSDIIWDFAVSCGLWASWQRALSVWCHPSARKNLFLSFCATAAAAAACEKTKIKVPSALAQMRVWSKSQS